MYIAPDILKSGYSVPDFAKGETVTQRGEMASLSLSWLRGRAVETQVCLTPNPVGTVGPAACSSTQVPRLLQVFIRPWGGQ